MKTNIEVATKFKTELHSIALLKQKNIAYNKFKSAITDAYAHFDYIAFHSDEPNDANTAYNICVFLEYCMRDTDEDNVFSIIEEIVSLE